MTADSNINRLSDQRIRQSRSGTSHVDERVRIAAERARWDGDMNKARFFRPWLTRAEMPKVTNGEPR